MLAALVLLAILILSTWRRWCARQRSRGTAVKPSPSVGVSRVMTFKQSVQTGTIWAYIKSGEDGRWYSYCPKTDYWMPGPMSLSPTEFGVLPATSAPGAAGVRR